MPHTVFPSAATFLGSEQRVNRAVAWEGRLPEVSVLSGVSLSGQLNWKWVSRARFKELTPETQVDFRVCTRSRLERGGATRSITGKGRRGTEGTEEGQRAALGGSPMNSPSPSDPSQLVELQ